MDGGAWWATVHGVAKSQTRLSDFTLTFHFHALEKEMATHCSVLAWRIPGMGEPGGLPSMGSHRVGHDWSDLAAADLHWPKIQWCLSVGFHSIHLTLLVFAGLLCSLTGTSLFATELETSSHPEGSVPICFSRLFTLLSYCREPFIPLARTAPHVCGTLRLQGFSVSLNRIVPKFFPLHEERESGFRAPFRKSWVLISELLASATCFRIAFPPRNLLCRMSFQRGLHKRFRKNSILYFSSWKSIMYINIWKILRRTAVNITCLKPNTFAICQPISTWNLLTSKSSSSDVTLKILKDIWEVFPWIQRTVHVVLFLCLRLELSFSSSFFPFSLLFSPTSLIQVLFLFYFYSF